MEEIAALSSALRRRRRRFPNARCPDQQRVAPGGARGRRPSSAERAGAQGPEWGPASPGVPSARRPTPGSSTPGGQCSAQGQASEQPPPASSATRREPRQPPEHLLRAWPPSKALLDWRGGDKGWGIICPRPSQGWST